MEERPLDQFYQGLIDAFMEDTLERLQILDELNENRSEEWDQAVSDRLSPKAGVSFPIIMPVQKPPLDQDA